jgi:hypothetical protein
VEPGTAAGRRHGVSRVVRPRDSQALTLPAGQPSSAAAKGDHDDWRWKTQNVLVWDNEFDFNPADIGSSCTAANGCGLQGLFSQYGAYPSWSPYQGTAVEQHIAYDQNNFLIGNVYHGRGASWPPSRAQR